MGADRIRTNDEGELVIETSVVSKLDTLIQGQSEGFARVETAMRNKADKSDLAKLEGRMEEHGRQIAELQSWRHDRQVEVQYQTSQKAMILTRREKLWGAVVAALTLAALWGAVIVVLVH